MKIPIQFSLALSVALCSLAGLTPLASAQTTVDPLEDLRTQDGGSGPFEGDSGSAQQGVFDIIHNSVLSNGTSVEEFNEARSENIEAEADSFREQQQRLLNQEAQGDAATENPQ